MKRKKIKKLNIDLLDDEVEKLYKKRRREYIAEYEEYEGGGFLTSGDWVNKPDVARAKWDKKYPEGINSWIEKQSAPTLNAFGEQEIINKINEIIDLLNEKKKEKRK